MVAVTRRSGTESVLLVLGVGLVLVAVGVHGCRRVEAASVVGDPTASDVAAERAYRASGPPARMDVRFQVGPGGWLQSLADAIKLPFKEQIISDTADRKVYFLAPVISTVPAFLAFSVKCGLTGSRTDARRLFLASIVYLPALLETRIRTTELSGVVEGAAADVAFDAQVVPVSVYWGRDPGQETSLWKLLFADSVQAGAIRKLLIMLVNSRNVYANFAEPLHFRDFVSKEASAEVARSM